MPRLGDERAEHVAAGIAYGQHGRAVMRHVGVERLQRGARSGRRVQQLP
eukprot:ctg_6608.g530